MRIGFDVDGVLANFTKSYETYLIETTGRDGFGNNRNQTPTEWSWEHQFGYTQEDVKKTWERIKGSYVFWDNLSPLPGLRSAVALYSAHDLYFITDRPGVSSMKQTQNWLSRAGIRNPNVIISRKGKGIVCAALDLELYIDDKVENILDVQEKAPQCAAYLAPQYPYNLNHPLFSKVHNSFQNVEQCILFKL